MTNNFSLIYDNAYDYAIKCINNHFSLSKKFEWYKKNIVRHGYDDFTFRYGNNVFSVLLDIQDIAGNSFLTKDYIRKQIYASNKYNTIPCKFPIKIKKINTSVPEFVTYNQSFNLYHTLSNESIDPQKLINNKKKSLSKWELRIYEIKFLCDYLSLNNFKVESYQDTLENNPQIWFKDDKNHLNWLIVKSKNKKDNNNEQEDTIIDEVIKTCYKFNGYYAELCIESGNLYRGKKPLFNLLKFEKVYEKSSFIDNKSSKFFNENMYKLIQTSILEKDISNSKKRVCVFPVPGYEDLLLRMPYALLKNIHLVRKDLVAIPFHYMNNILENEHFGLPLYHIDTSDSACAQKGYITPKDVVFLDSAKTGLMILRKAKGEPVVNRYKFFFESMIGLTNQRVDFHEFGKIMEINISYGKNAVAKILDFLKQKKYTIYPNELCEGSKTYQFEPSQDFYVFYKLCVTKFLETLKDLSNLKIENYQNAINNILSEKEFIFDFYNPSNVFIDWDTGNFNFIDFIFDPQKVKKKDLKEQILYFRNALYGVYASNLVNPEDLLFYDGDIEKFDEFAKSITDKINQCVPNELKIANIKSK